jgi:hypothetical protein
MTSGHVYNEEKNDVSMWSFLIEYLINSMTSGH